MSTLTTAAACTHACQEGCGRPYDLVVVMAIDGSCLMHCIPCHQAFIVSMTKAMVEPDDAQVQEVMASADLADVLHVDPDAPGYTMSDVYLDAMVDGFEFDGTEEE